MPKKYENKSLHNKNFLDYINQDYPHEFFDWKVTVQFYCSLHLCYCVLETSGLNVLTSHSANIKNLKGIDASLSKKLFLLYKNSRQSRYDGFINEAAMLRINKINFEAGTTHLKQIESECLKYYPTPVV